MPQSILLPNSLTDELPLRPYFQDDAAAACLADLVTSWDKVAIARPHGMGKTTLLMQLYLLFAQGTASCPERALAAAWPDTKTYPVIYLNLHHEAMSHDDDNFEQGLKAKLRAAYLKAGFAVDEIDPQQLLSNYLCALRRASYEAGQSLVILIDDWDYPLLLKRHQLETYQTICAILGTLFAWIDNYEHLRFVLVTGTQRLTEVLRPYHCDLQDLTLEPISSELLGLRPTKLRSSYRPVLEAAAAKLGLIPDQLADKLESYYGGWRPDPEEPNSVLSPLALNCFFAALSEPQTSAEQAFKSYWSKSAPQLELPSTPGLRAALASNKLVLPLSQVLPEIPTVACAEYSYLFANGIMTIKEVISKPSDCGHELPEEDLDAWSDVLAPEPEIWVRCGYPNCDVAQALS